LPHLARVIVEEVAVAAGLLLVMARARAPGAACPKCGTVSGQVRSRYRRRLADAAIGGRQVEIRLGGPPAPGSSARRVRELHATSGQLLMGFLNVIAGEQHRGQ
jgi:hypothetical protein